MQRLTQSAAYASIEQRFDGVLMGATAWDWAKVTQQFERLQSQMERGVEVRSPSTFLFKQKRDGDRADRVAGIAAFAIEAIEFGAEMVAAVFQSWQPKFATAVVGWMRVHAGWAVDRIRQMCPAMQFNATPQAYY